ncbi:MAG: PhnE/PtxC family ABC transporter permease [Candidatus Binatia bacterium]
MNGSSPERERAHISWPSHEAGGKPNLGTYILLGTLIAFFIWSYQGSQIHLAQLLSRDGGGQILVYIKKLFPPDFSATVLREALRGVIETFAISLMGTLMAVVIALSLVFFASRNLIYSGLLYEMEPKGGGKRTLRLVPYLYAKAF